MKFLISLTLILSCIKVSAQDTWSAKASMNVARSGGAAAVINNKLYVVGGSPSGGGSTQSLEVYDPATNGWTSLANMPTTRAVAAAVAVNGKLYVIGGCVNSDCNSTTAVVEIYDPATNTWTAGASMPSPRALVACAAIGDKIYVAGNYNPTSGAIVYDLNSNAWSSIAAMPVSLSHAGGANVNGKFYVIGGSNGSSAQSGVYEYDPAANSWTTKASLPTARYVPGVGVINNQIFVVSGQGSSAITNVLEVFNPATNSWSSKANIITPRYGPATAAIGNVLYVAGSSSTNGSITTVEAFTSTPSGTWTTKANMTTGRWGFGIGNINGAYVAGGFAPSSHLTNVDVYNTSNNSWTAKATRPSVQTNPAYGVINGLLYTAGGTNTSVEIADLHSYNPSSDSWTQRTSMSSAIQGASGGVLNNLLYVAGGRVGSVSSNSLRSYDPANNSWTNRTAMPTARYGAAAGVINGKLYVVGGVRAENGAVQSVVEEYNPISNTWATKAQMLTPRFGAAYEVLNGELYVMGGSNSSNTPTTVVESYNPSTDSWTIHSSLANARTYAGAITQNGMIYIIGGHNSSNSVVLPVEEFSSGIGSAPSISGFTPSSGPVGTSVTITGLNFSTTAANNSVTFNGVTASAPSTSSATSLTVTVPAGATTGPIAVTVSGQTGTSSSNFTVLATEPSSAAGSLTFTSIAQTQVTLNFPAASSITNANGYIILRRQGTAAIANTGITDGISPASLSLPAGVSLVTTISSTSTTSYTDTGLTQGTSYTYGIVPFNIIGSIVTSYNYFTTTITGGTTTTSSPDSTPPNLTDNTPTTVDTGVNLTFNATINDGESAITIATVEWRSISAGGSFTTTNLTANGTTYTATINASSINELGIEYKISATSAGGTTTSGASYKTVRVSLPSNDQGLTIAYFDFGSNESNYRIVAVPLQLSSNTVNAVFNELGTYDKTKWRMYRYDNGTTSELNGSTPLLPGLGYWLIAKNNPGSDIKTGPGSTVNVTAAAPFEIDLKVGWNQIGNPYYFNLSWADVQAANPGLPKLRIYDGAFRDATVLDATTGGFVNVTTAQKLKFPVVKNPAVNGRVSESSTFSDLGENNWEVKFLLTQGEVKNFISGFGMHESARSGFDEWDGINMPAFFEHELHLNHPKRQGEYFFSHDVVHTADQHIWNFTIEASGEERVRLEWNNQNFGDNDKALYLWDAAEQRAINMRTINFYEYDSRQSRSFRIVFGSQEFARQEISVPELVLHTVWPNPMTKNFTIPFSLPQSTQPHVVSFELVDVLGRTYWTHEGKFGSGYHEIKADIENLKQGVHILQLRTGTTRKHIKVIVKE